MPYINRNIGQRMREIRCEQGLTQEQLAEKAEVKQYQTVGAWERGAAIPSLSTMLKLCDIYGCQLGYLLGDYVAETWDQSKIVEKTSLLPAAVKTLVSLSPVQIAFLDDLLQNNKELDKIAKKYAAYKYAKHVIAPAADKYAEELQNKQIIVEGEIDGERMPSVPVQDQEDYTRFELIRAVVNFADMEG